MSKTQKGLILRQVGQETNCASHFFSVVVKIMPPFIVTTWLNCITILSSIWPSHKDRDFNLFPMSQDDKICTLYMYKVPKVISENIKHDFTLVFESQHSKKNMVEAWWPSKCHKKTKWIIMITLTAEEMSVRKKMLEWCSSCNILIKHFNSISSECVFISIGQIRQRSLVHTLRVRQSWGQISAQICWPCDLGKVFILWLSFLTCQMGTKLAVDKS